MTDALYLTDAYLTEFTGRVVAQKPEGLVLDRTAFYPTGGGQPCDTGSLLGPGGERWTVKEVAKSPSGIVHRLAEERGPPEGTELRGAVDWRRRHLHMRYHTALHILSGVVFHRFGSGITGGQIYDDRARMDFSLPDFTPALAQELIDGLNEVVHRALPVTVRFIPRAEFDRDPDLVRVAPNLMPDVQQVRLIDIEGFDVQADGGTHVRSTAEVGAASLGKIENKGARNKRLYLSLASGTGD